jgi:hypothetical protein
MLAEEAVNAIDWVVCPVDQTYESAVDELKITVSPLQAVVDVAVIVGIGALLTFTFMLVDVAEQLLASVTVTEKLPELETVIVDAIEPFDQRFPVVEDEERTTDPPVQNVVEPLALIVGVAGSAFTVTVTIALGLSSPAAFFWLI